MSPWQALDSVHGWRATETEWRRKLGDGYEAIRPLLTKDGGLASEVLLPDERRPRRVVMHSKADIVAINDDTDHAVQVTLEEVVLHSLMPRRMCAELAKYLHLGKPADAPCHGTSAWQLGDFIPYEGERFPVYLLLDASAAMRCNAIKTIAGSVDSPFVAMVLHAGHACDQLRDVAHSCKAGLATTDHVMMLIGAKAPHEALRKQLDPFVRRFVRPTEPSDAGRLRFPTPPGSRWTDVKLKFLDGHTVTATVRDVQRMLRYDQMGFMDKRDGSPNILWDLLRVFADDGGTISWESDGASHKREKQVERLNDQLYDFFLIPGAPIAPDAAAGGWSTPIQLQPP
jgi:hypothetical protein